MKSRKQRSMQVVLSVLFTGLALGGLCAETVRNIPGWGAVTDPDGDCTFKTEKGKVTVTVPGTLHDLNPQANKNAPRILQEIEGDFTVQVRVSSDFEPGDEAAGPGVVSFNGAGLLIWHTDKDYLRLERDIWVTPQGERASYAPLFEYWKDDTNTNPHNGTLKPFFKGRSTYLRITRHGEVFTIAVSHHGAVWLAKDSVATDLPKRIKVGVSAINTSKKPFTVEFAELKVTTR